MRSPWNVQLSLNPYEGEVQFDALASLDPGTHALDAVSLADLFRNGFVCPPHSIYEEVRVATMGFDPQQDLMGAPRFELPYRSGGLQEGRSPTAAPSGAERERWVHGYHRRLCEAVERSTGALRSPWFLQSGGKDSTSLAIALAEARPHAVCVTYLGGNEEDEVASARAVARTLGLRHEVVLCDPGRAYDRYLKSVSGMPLLTGDFALLSYADLAAEVAGRGGDGLIDGLGSDQYFGAPASWVQGILWALSRERRVPRAVMASRLASSSFEVSFALGTIQMTGLERLFPGSRFDDREVDALFGTEVAERSRRRLGTFDAVLRAAQTLDDRRALAVVLSEGGAAFPKGLLTGAATSLRVAYPFCDERLADWVSHEVPSILRFDRRTRTNKVLVRDHIAARLGALPYVRKKGSFRFDLRGLAKESFDQVHAFASELREVLPGAAPWLESNRRRLGNKYHASQFYLLAVALPWVRDRLGRGYELSLAKLERGFPIRP